MLNFDEILTETLRADEKIGEPKAEKPKELKGKGAKDHGKLKKMESKVDEEQGTSKTDATDELEKSLKKSRGVRRNGNKLDIATGGEKSIRVKVLGYSKESKDGEKNETRKVSEGLELANKFGVFGYDVEDVNTWSTHYDTEEEAKGAAMELARDLNGRDLAYVEVWQADENGLFGVSGKPIWRQEYKE